jgi:predicted nuclease of predicted toxin-antitoxin system
VRLLADENVPRLAIEALRAAGHSVEWVADFAPSTEDGNVLAMATERSALLVTMDRDFGDLAVQRGLPAPCGIMLLRLPPLPRLVARVCVAALAATTEYAERFVVVSEDRIRIRSLVARL